MPTGYTAKLVESGQSFEEFVLTCARGFGACIDMRDEPLTTPIPNEFKPSPYFSESLKKAQEELSRFESMSPKEQYDYGRKKKENRIAEIHRILDKESRQNKRVHEMLEKVKRWTPPSKDHDELKKFMIQQLTISLSDTEYWKQDLAKCTQRPPLEFYREKVEALRWSIDYDIKHSNEEVEREAKRTTWVKQLRESLG